MLLDSTQITQFQADGYLAVPGLLTREELHAASAAVDQAVAGRTAHDTRALADKSSYEQSFIQCMRLWEDHADVRAFTFNANIAHAAAELLGVERVRLWQDQAL